MKVLVLGAGGFIGRHLDKALRAAGHLPVSGRPDWTKAHEPEAWRPLLAGIDAAIYLPGSVRDRAAGRSGWLNLLHHRAPLALASAGAPRLVHVSALCAGDSAYARSKQAGDAALLGLAHPALHVVRPSLVLGPGGLTSGQLQWLSRMPLWPLPAAMQRCRLQPLRVEDLAEALVRLLGAEPSGLPLIAAGDEIDTLPAWLQRRRAQQGLGPARLLTLPDTLTRLSARVGNQISWTSWNEQTLDLLQHDSIANDPAQTCWLRGLLGRPPRPALEGAW